MLAGLEERSECLFEVALVVSTGRQRTACRQLVHHGIVGGDELDHETGWGMNRTPWGLLVLLVLLASAAIRLVHLDYDLPDAKVADAMSRVPVV